MPSGLALFHGLILAQCSIVRLVFFSLLFGGRKGIIVAAILMGQILSRLTKCRDVGNKMTNYIPSHRNVLQLSKLLVCLDTPH